MLFHCAVGNHADKLTDGIRDLFLRQMAKRLRVRRPDVRLHSVSDSGMIWTGTVASAESVQINSRRRDHETGAVAVVGHCSWPAVRLQGRAWLFTCGPAEADTFGDRSSGSRTYFDAGSSHAYADPTSADPYGSTGPHSYNCSRPYRQALDGGAHTCPDAGARCNAHDRHPCRRVCDGQ